MIDLYGGKLNLLKCTVREGSHDESEGSFVLDKLQGLSLGAILSLPLALFLLANLISDAAALCSVMILF